MSNPHPIGHPAPVWATPENLELVLRLWKAGVKIVDIARSIGVSHNAIRGYSFRHKDLFGPHPNQPTGKATRDAMIAAGTYILHRRKDEPAVVPRPPRPLREMRVHWPHISEAGTDIPAPRPGERPAPTYPVPSRVERPGCAPRPRYAQCQWFEGEDRQSRRQCSAATAGWKSPYCAEHERLCYLSRRQVRERQHSRLEAAWGTRAIDEAWTQATEAA